ncbi:MAG: hypothetical protein OXG98_02445, partial [Gemmatimonadetes bacterium]|nr:hypothetical protein [Gemmatimonadota bacterium]
ELQELMVELALVDRELEETYALHDLRLARLVTHVDQDDATSIERFRNLGFRIEKNMHPLYGGYVAILDT